MQCNVFVFSTRPRLCAILPPLQLRGAGRGAAAQARQGERHPHLSQSHTHTHGASTASRLA